MKNDQDPSEELAFRAHLILMSGTQQGATVRMLLVAMEGARAVYEGSGPWSVYKSWISRLANTEDQKRELQLAAKLLVRDRFTSVQELKISSTELTRQGFLRVDGGP